MHSAGPRTLAADRSVYALWPLAAGCHTIDYYYSVIICRLSMAASGSFAARNSRVKKLHEAVVELGVNRLSTVIPEASI